ncbi:hypothetical protein ABMA28_012463 [Loxostege sticticalis]|uniref:Uncharacterized protein n=1 Tax=Loxostege sticticalis TaxID=481309 RepID=A0ABD0S3X8_LOXSC
MYLLQCLFLAGPIILDDLCPYQRLSGTNYDLGLSQTTVSDCLSEVTEAMNSPDILRKYIKFQLHRNNGKLCQGRINILPCVNLYNGLFRCLQNIGLRT